MAVGIFRDPKMNQRERNYGIIWSIDKSESYFYAKGEDDWTRLALFGEVAEYDDKSVEPPLADVESEDYEIKGTVELVESLRDDDKSLQISPVYTRIGRKINDNERRQAIRDAIENGLESDFDYPPSNTK
ncbi:MAG: hypothetical protein KFF73_16615 [Cyclobacteriaceae bacterium]|nr:hypothetical protein [Cyclobacteriaceae bacterium]